MSASGPKPEHPVGSNRSAGLIGIFSHHPVAANLLMVMMLLAGVWGLKQLNTQFFPTINVDYASVRVVWSSASAEDVEELITTPIEQALRNVDLVKEITSTSAEGVASITLEFEEDADMGLAIDQVKDSVDLVRNLPAGSENPEVSQITRYESVTRLLVTGPDDLSELRPLVNRFEEELLERGIAKIFIRGLPQEQIAIEVPSATLRQLDLSLDELGRRISAWSRDVPLGIIGREETSRQLRIRERRQNALDFESIPIIAQQQGRLLTLGSIAAIKQISAERQISIQHNGKPAVEMTLNRTESSDSLKSARIFNEWLEVAKTELPEGVTLIPFNQRWEILKGRIDLLVTNGLGGLFLIVIILFLFMSGRVAWWTAVGIPVSFMAALAVLYSVGGSINMISLFALIMALGIIVDDAIVVGEDAMALYESGISPAIASESAARRMLGPVFSSSLTTIAAFMPLLLVGGIIGSIMQAIPVVIVCVIVASLVECFLILPGHLTQSFAKMGEYNPGKLRRKLEQAISGFREKVFRPFVSSAISFRWTTLSLLIALLIVTVGWFQSGRIGFQFFPTAEGDRIYVNLGFVSGTSKDKVTDFLQKVEDQVYQLESEFEEELVSLVITRHGTTESDNRSATYGDHFGAVRIELVDPDQRNTRNRDIISYLREKLPLQPAIEFLSFAEPRAGPPGNDIDLRISGQKIHQVKLASEKLQEVLLNIQGVSGIGDDAPYGREQMILQLTPTAEVLGLTTENVSSQLRAAFDGFEVQELSNGYDDIDVRLTLPAQERNSLSGLSALDIVLPNGQSEPISNLATVNSERGFESIRHSNGKLAITVVASVDPAVNNANKIRANLEKNILPQLAREYGVRFTFQGRQADQAETLGDMKLGSVLALTMIYLVLAWVFGSYGWPMIVMFIIPFGLVGAIWGHVALGHDITILSLFGFFGLSGIVVNDSIILVVFYRQLRDQGMTVSEAVVEAACRRLRAVLLTSLTTIAGLTPLLFETSLQAQFLIPMAITLAFGLGFSTILVLVVVPTLLSIYENERQKYSSAVTPEAIAD